MRRRLLKTVTDLREGAEPREPHAGSGYRVRPIDIVLDNGVAIWDGARDYLEAVPGSPIRPAQRPSCV